MCVEVYATYVCNHTVPLWVPCRTFSMKSCPKYQRQHRNRPLRCSCTCKAPVSLTEALQENSFADGLLQIQLGSDMGSSDSNGNSFTPDRPRARDSVSPDTTSSPSSSSSSSGSSTGMRTPTLGSAPPTWRY